MHAFSRLIFGFLTALAGAQLALWLHLPLPWLLGPLLLTAVCSARGWPISGHTLFRNAGQWCIGTSLGLYFTPAMLGVIAVNIPPLPQPCCLRFCSVRWARRLITASAA